MFAVEAKSAGHAVFLQLQAERIATIGETLLALFPDPVKLVLELGCGHGHYLTAYAEAHPDAHCVGIDLVSKRIGKANAKRDKRSLQRLHFMKAEAREFMKALPEHVVLERVFILFPDPWPKKRHAKNRMIQSSLLDDLASHGFDGTALHFRTDDENNFAWGMDVVATHPAWSICDDVDWPFENPSFFQNLFSRYDSLTARLVPG